MQRNYGHLTRQAKDYVGRIDQSLANKAPGEIACRLRELVLDHDAWRTRQAISLNAAENVLSRHARTLLSSDMATRVTEGFPGDKDFPAHYQNRYIDEIEATIICQLRRLFRARHVEWRPVSTSMANATVFFALATPNGTIMAQPEAAGGNYSYNPVGPPRAAGLTVLPLPCKEESFEIDADAAAKAIVESQPSIVAIGGSNVLFPYPVAQLKEAADRAGSIILYDAAHLGLLIACGKFQDPFAEGADILTMSSQKVMSGPVGGFILTNRDDLADRILPYSFPTLIQTRDQNKYAAAAHALTEMTAFGKAYAEQMLRNAQALAVALEQQGFSVVASDRGYTRTHQIFVLIDKKDSEEFEHLCQRANLLLTRAQRMGALNHPATRLTSQEISRRGMKEEHMPIIANWLKRVIVNRENPERIAAEVEEFLTEFQSIHFSFDGDS